MSSLTEEPVRLHKLLARAGVGSLRQMEWLIESGVVTVNGQVATPGMHVNADDEIAIEGKLVSVAQPETTRVLLYHKQKSEIVSHDDPEQREQVFGNLPELTAGKWISVGRLDVNTEGLLIFTNQGELAHRLMHPRFLREREYRVRVHGPISEEVIAQLRQGVELEEGIVARFEHLELETDPNSEASNHWYRAVLMEGRRREIRRLFQAVGLEVSRLIRVRFGSQHLGAIEPGTWRELSTEEAAALVAELKLEQPDEEQRERHREEHAGSGQRRPSAPRREFSERPPRGNFESRPPREGGFSQRSEGGGFRGGGERRSFGERPRGGFDSRPPREGGFSQRSEGGGFRGGDRGYGDRPRSFDSRPPREGGFGQRSEGGGFRGGDNRGYGDRPRSFDSRPPREGGFSQRSEGGGFRGGDRGYGDRPRSFDSRPPREGGFGQRSEGGGFRGGDRGYGDRPRSFDSRPPREGGDRGGFGRREAGAYGNNRSSYDRGQSAGFGRGPAVSEAVPRQNHGDQARWQRHDRPDAREDFRPRHRDAEAGGDETPRRPRRGPPD